LRLKRYELASSLYRKASSRGWKLRDMQINHFEAELKSGNLIEAFKLASALNSLEPVRKPFLSIAREIRRKKPEERFELIRSMNLHDNIPEEFVDLVSKKLDKVPEKRTSDQKYTLLDDSDIDIEKFRRELYRVRTSPSFAIGDHMIRSYRKPWLIPLLPISLPLLGLKLLRERRDHYSPLPNLPSTPLNQLSSGRRSIVMFPTNGVGFGHFTRLLSLARKLKKADPKLEIVFFTTMPTLHILEDEGFPAYHFPGRYKFHEMEPREWNSIAEEMLSMIFTLHNPSAFIFDGAYPYRGMLNALRGPNSNMLKIWLRRGAFKSGTKGVPEDSFSYFDAIIRPGDSMEISEEEREMEIPTIRCNPITMFDSEELYPRGTLRSRMGIPNEATLAYVQLGAGKINNINSELKITLEALDKFEHVFTVHAESILGERHSFDFPRLRTLRDYPNSIFFNDFDMSIMAAGYNSFHEVIQSGLPTLCYPNMNTGRDDQLARASVAADAGCMIVLEKRTRRMINASIERLVQTEVQDEMRKNCEVLQRTNGAIQAAEWILEKIS
jgi:hypothetical protein